MKKYLKKKTLYEPHRPIVVFVTRFSKEHLMGLPSNFSYYVKDMFSSERVDVRLINQNDYEGNILIKTWRIAKQIRKIHADIVYLTLWMGYNNIVIAKILHLIKCKIAIWKYTYCIEGTNLLSRFFFKKIYWPNINRIYMMFDNHTEDAIKKNIVGESQIVTLSRGADIEWYEQFQKDKTNYPFRIIATGKDHRDYLTLGQACEETCTQCEILTFKHKSCLDAAERFKNSKYVHFTFMENGYSIDSYRYVVEEVSKSSVMAICCEKLPYGAGYTNIVECLAFKIPILQTLNPDVHLDPEREGIGFSIQPYDVEGWKNRIIQLRDDKKLRDKMANNIHSLLDGEYNSIATANYIINDFLLMVNDL